MCSPVNMWISVPVVVCRRDGCGEEAVGTGEPFCSPECSRIVYEQWEEKMAKKRDPAHDWVWVEHIWIMGIVPGPDVWMQEVDARLNVKPKPKVKVNCLNILLSELLKVRQ